MYSSLFGSSKLTQLKIYYLFAHADGELSMYEERKLTSIAHELEISESEIQEYNDFRKKTSSLPNLCNSQNVIQEIDALLDESKSSFSFFGGSTLDRSKEEQVQTIWTLINLGYADKDFSAEERKVISHLINRWETDSMIVDEFYDTANTLLALTRQKEWIISSSRPYAEIRKMEEEIDKSIASMFTNIKISISEIEIA